MLSGIGRGYYKALIGYSEPVEILISFRRDESIPEPAPKAADITLEDLRHYLIENQIVFSADLGLYKILFQKLSAERARPVVIDGFGNHIAINWLGNIDFLCVVISAGAGIDLSNV